MAHRVYDAIPSSLLIQPEEYHDYKLAKKFALYPTNK